MMWRIRQKRLDIIIWQWSENCHYVSNDGGLYRIISCSHDVSSFMWPSSYDQAKLYYLDILVTTSPQFSYWWGRLKFLNLVLCHVLFHLLVHPYWKINRKQWCRKWTWRCRLQQVFNCRTTIRNSPDLHPVPVSYTHLTLPTIYSV